jgi:hypothetical protein
MCDCYREYDVEDARRAIADLSSRLEVLEEQHIDDWQVEKSIHLKALLEKKIAQRKTEYSFNYSEGHIESVTSLSLWELIELLLGSVTELQQEVATLKERLHG